MHRDHAGGLVDLDAVERGAIATPVRGVAVAGMAVLAVAVRGVAVAGIAIAAVGLGFAHQVQQRQRGRIRQS